MKNHAFTLLSALGRMEAAVSTALAGVFSQKKLRCIKTAWMLFLCTCSLLIFACGGTPQANSPDDLDLAIRDASDYLNENIPAGSKIVILNIESNSTALSEYIIDELIANAVNDRLFEVVDRQQLDLIREEQNFQWAGEVDDNLALEVGRFFGAQIIVSGRVSQIADRYRFTIRALEVQTARVVGQNNINIAAGATITALMRQASTGGFQATAAASGQSSGGQRTQTTSESGTAQTAPAQPTTPTPQATAPNAQPAAIPNGTYTFWPRPRAKQAGIPVNAYLEKIVVSSGYLIVYLNANAQGSSTRESPSGGNGWFVTSPAMIQDLDNLRNSWQGVDNSRDTSGDRYISFQGVTARRFSLTNNYGNPPTIFEEINLADAEFEPDGSGTAQAAQPAAQPATIRNGTYTFWPRPRAKRAGVPVDAYLEKIVVSSGYLIVFVNANAQGPLTSAKSPSGGNGWFITSLAMIQDLDNPRFSWQGVSNSGDTRGDRYISFQGVTARRFSLTNTYDSVPTIFDEINLADAEWEP